MTILTSSSRASTLSTAGTTNNPFLTGAALTGTATTSLGTQVQAATNAETGTTFDHWTATPSSTEARWRIVFASNQTPTFVGLAAHNLADVSATVGVRYSTDSGSSWTDCGCGTTTPTDNQAIGFRFDGIKIGRAHV